MHITGKYLDIKTLPLQAKRLFVLIYKKALDSGKSEKESVDFAWKSIKSKYIKKNDKWVVKQSLHLKGAVGKTGLFRPLHYFDAVLSDTSKDTHGHTVSPVFLSNLYNSFGKLETVGDIGHLNFFKNDSRYKGVYKLLKKSFNGMELKLRFILDRTHQKYKEVLAFHNKNKELGLSAEFYSPKMENNEIVGADSVGWSVVIDPANEKYFKTEE